MSLQSNSLGRGRPQCRARNRARTGIFQRLGFQEKRRQSEHLAVFREFSGRLVHLAIQVKEDSMTATRDPS